MTRARKVKLENVIVVEPYGHGRDWTIALRLPGLYATEKGARGARLRLIAAIRASVMAESEK